MGLAEILRILKDNHMHVLFYTFYFFLISVTAYEQLVTSKYLRDWKAMAVFAWNTAMEKKWSRNILLS